MTFAGHKYLPKIRMAILTLALAGGMMFAIYIQPPRGSQLSFLFFPPKRSALLFYPYVVAALYTYVIWGPTTRKFAVNIYARAFLILGLAIGWLYLVLEVLAAIDNTSGQRVLGCLKTSKYCQVRRSSDLMGAVAGFLIVIEVVLTLKYGRVDHNSTEEQARAMAQGKDGGVPTQHGAPILISDQQYQHYQYLMQQQQHQQQQLQPQFQQQLAPQMIAQPLANTPSQVHYQPSLAPSPSVNYSTRPQ
ncbi:hypothetical protein BGZ74_004188, partial [Mortierella antarctica]